MTEQFERSARFWLRAYPRRWRRERADEVLGVLADLAEPGATRVGVRSALGLLLAGWAVRWRGRPLPHRWLGYRVLDLRLPREYRGWIADDIDGCWYALRQGNALVLAVILVLFSRVVGAPSLSFVVPWLVATAVMAAVQSRRGRRMAREKHLVADPGEPLFPGTYVAMGVPRPRVAARWASSRLVATLAVCGLAAVLALLAAPTMPAVVPVPGLAYPANFQFGVASVGPTRWALAGAAAVLAAAALLVAVRVRRVLGDRVAHLPDQPDREVRVPGRWADVGVVGVALVVSLDAWAEATGRTPLLFGPVVAMVVALGLPIAVALRRHGAAVGWRTPGGAQLAWTALTWAARHDNASPLDRPVRRVRRWDGPYVPGQVVLGPQRCEPPWPPVAT